MYLVRIFEIYFFYIENNTKKMNNYQFGMIKILRK